MRGGTIISNLNSVHQIACHTVKILKENDEFYKRIPENLRNKIDQKDTQKSLPKSSLVGFNLSIYY
ncbi:hypothetical protein NT95_00075 [Oenococcus kitaharae]|nr:hypothetical protein NT96_07035 [Oenococcus kitaharae]OEY82569.1 hypothetical protein NV75_07480 [Oenococcus kitaharae]OEY84824.1 hypothetical protein NT95_00075 [Oenococcus kitaharae]